MTIDTMTNTATNTTTNVATQTTTEENTQPQSLREHVLKTLNYYFESLDGKEPIGIKSLVLEEVESAAYEAVMRLTKGNQSRGAILMGVSRGTLRTKLEHYFGTTHIGLPEKTMDSAS